MIDVLMDLRLRFGPVRDQGMRPTCMAFAASDANAHASNAVEPFSVEFAFFHAVRRRRPFDPSFGVSFSQIADALQVDGQPTEQKWPYLLALPANILDWSPPPGCTPLFRRDYEIEPGSLDRVFQLLRSSQPVVLTMHISDSFYRPGSDGAVRAANGEPAVASHAVVAVGQGRENNTQMILVRNSWGEMWGLNGHAWLSEGYLQGRLLKIGIAAGRNR